MSVFYYIEKKGIKLAFQNLEPNCTIFKNLPSVLYATEYYDMNTLNETFLNAILTYGVVTRC